MKPPRAGPTPLRFEALEPRILYSADAALLLGAVGFDAVAEHRVLPAAQAPAASAANATSAAPVGQDTSAASAAAVDAQPASPLDTADIDTANVDTATQPAIAREIVFVDSRVPDAQRFVDDLVRQRGAGRDIEVVMLDAAADGVAQIADVLAGERGLAAVHIVSHGGSGAIDIGATRLDAATLAADAAAVAGWGAALASDGDLLLYGCDVASTDAGRAFVQTLAALTGADVAASDDPTGNALRGGDWQLEYETGHVEATLAPSAAFQQSWQGLLAGQPPVIDLDANNSSGAAAGGFNGSWVEGGGPVHAADTDATLTDPDSVTLASLTVAITNRVNGAAETLAATTGGTLITASFNAGTGVLTLSGTDLVGNYQQVLRSITYDNGSDDPGSNSRSVTFVATDGNGNNSAGVTATIAVTPADDAPSAVLLLAPGTANQVSNGSFEINNVTSGPTSGTGVTVAGWTATGPNGFEVWKNYNNGPNPGPANASDGASRIELDVNNAIDGISQGVATTAGQSYLLSFDFAHRSGTPGSGVDVFWRGSKVGTFQTSVVAWQTYRVVVTGSGGNDTLAFTETADSNDGSGSQLDNVRLNALPQAPLAVAENSAAGTVVANASTIDPDGGDSFVYTLADSAGGRFAIDAASGVVSVGSGAPLDYETASSHTITVRSTDSGGLYREQAFTIGVTDVNEAPTAVADSAIAVEAGGIGNATAGTDPSGNVLANDTDPDAGDTKTVIGAVAGVAPVASGIAASIAGSYGTLVGAANGAHTYTVDNGNAAVQALHDAGTTLTDTFTYTMRDAAGLTSTAQLTVTIRGADDAPVASTSSGAAAYVENAAGTPVDPGFVVSDVDDASLAGATVAITANFQAGQDVLGFVDGNGITGSWNAGTGVLTLSGSASVAQYQAALRSVTYANTSDDPSTATRTVSFAASDGSLTSTAASRNVAVTAVNDLPVNQLPATIAATEDVPTRLAGLSISDPDAGSSLLDTTLTVGQGVLTAASGGGVTVSGSGTAALNLRGTLADLNAYLATAASQPLLTTPTDYHGSVRLGMVTADGRNTGSGGAVAAGAFDYLFQDAAPQAVVDSTGVATDFNVGALAIRLSGSNQSFNVTYTGVVDVAAAGSYSFTARADDDARLYVDGTQVLYAFFGTASGAVNLSSGQHSLAIRYGQDTGGAGLSASYSGPDTAGAATALLASPHIGRLVSQTATATVVVAAVNDAPNDVAVLSPAAVNLVVNGSFEVNSGAANAATVGSGVTVSGWTAIGSDGFEVWNNYNDTGNGGALAGPAAASDGTSRLELDVLSRSVNGGSLNGISQTIATSAGQDYLLAFDFANRNGSAAGSSGVDVFWRGSKVATIDQTAVGWQTYRLILTGSGGADVLSFVETAATDDGSGSQLDNVRLFATRTPAIAVAENAANGTVVANAVAVDPDAGDSATYTLTDSAGGRFAIDAASGAISVADGTRLDFEAATAHAVTVRATDSGGLFHERVVGIGVVDVNEPIVAVPDAAIAVEAGGIANGSPGVDPGGNLLANDTDPDAGDTKTVIGLATGVVASASGPVGSLAGSYGTVVAAANGDYTYTVDNANPAVQALRNAGATLTDVFTYSVRDAAGLVSSTQLTVTIRGANDAPVVAASSGTLAYTENDAATPVDAAVMLSDVDDTSLAGATVAITAHYNRGQDVLGFADQNGIAGSWNVATGVLTLSGSASVAQYQAALRSVTYANGSDDPATATRTVSFTVSDGSALSAVATRDIAVVAVDDAPAVSTSGGSAAYTENAAPVAIDAGLTLADPDHTVLAGATVVITGNYRSGEDVLGFADQNGITGNWSAATGTLTLSGTASVAQYQAALRSVSYANGSDDPSTAPRSVSFSASDGSLTSPAASRSVTVTAVNDVPVSHAPASLAAVEDTPLVLTGLSISDPDAGSSLLTTTLKVGSGTLSAVAGGAVTVSGSGTGSLTLAGTLADLNAYLASAGRPVFTAPADFAGTVTLSMITSDSVNAGTGGVLQAGAFDYRFQVGTPAGLNADNISAVGGIVGVVTSLGNVGGLATALSGSSDNFGIIFGGVLDVTTAGSYTFQVGADDAAKLYVDGALAVNNYHQTAAVGSVSLAAGRHRLELRYFDQSGGQYLNASYSGADTGSVNTPLLASPAVGRLVSATATTVITVAPVNDAPVLAASGGTASYTENAAPVVVDGGITVSDVDSANLVSARVAITTHFIAGQDTLAFADQNGITGSWNAASGVLTLTGSATVAQYQAALRSVTYANGSDSPTLLARGVSFSVHDGADASGAVVRSVAVSAVDDAPVDTVLLGPTAANLVVNGSFEANSGAPNAISGGPGVAVAGWTATGGEGFEIWNGYNDAAAPGPATASDGTSRLELDVGAGLNGISQDIATTAGQRYLLSFDFAHRGGTAPIDHSGVDVYWRGSRIASIDQTATAWQNWRFVVTGSGGNDTLAFVETADSNDGVGSQLDDVRLVAIEAPRITVAENAANGTPVATAVSIDPDGGSDRSVYTLLDSAGGRFAIDAVTGVIRVADGSALNFEAATSHAVTVRATDGGGLFVDRVFAIGVTDVNEPIDALPDAAFAVEAGGIDNAVPGSAATGNLLANDHDPDAGDTQTVTGVVAGSVGSGGNAAGTVGGAVAGSYGSVVVAADGSWRYDVDDGNAAVQALHDAGTTLVDTFTYSVRDSGGLVSRAQLTVTIRGADDAPVVVTSAAAGPLAYAENDAPTAVDPGLLLSDVDDTLLAGARVVIVGHYAAGEDVLAFVDRYGIVGNWDAASGVLTLSGSATVAQYQAALRSVTYADGSDSPSTATRTIAFSVDDGVLGSAVATRAIAVTAVDDAPSGIVFAPLPAVPGAVPSVAENAANGTFVATATAVDPDAGDTAVYTLVDSAGGRFAIDAATGVITVADGSRLDFESTASHDVVVRATDGGGLFVERRLTIALTDVNEPVFARPDNAVAVEAGGAANGTPGVDPRGNVLANDSDADAGDTLTVTGVAAIDVVDGTGGGGSAAGPVSGAVGTPVAGRYGVVVIAADGSFVYTVDNANAAVQALRAAGSTLTDSFTYTVRDAAGLASSARLTVTIAGADDAPVLAVHAGATVAEGSTGNVITAAMLAASDVDTAAAALRYTLTDAPAHGSLRLGGVALAAGDSFTQADIDAGLLGYDHDGSETRADGFAFTLDDGSGESLGGSFTLRVTAVNDEAPVISAPGTQRMAEDGVLRFGSAGGNAIRISDGDLVAADGDAITGDVQLTLTASHGTLTLASLAGLRVTAGSDGSATLTLIGSLADLNAALDGLRFAADADFHGAASLELVASDLGGGGEPGDGSAGPALVGRRTVAIDVVSVDDAPRLAANTGATVAEGSAGRVIGSASLAVVDIDDAPERLVYTLAAAPVHGTLRLNGVALATGSSFTQAGIDAGALTYDHDGSETTADGFDFTVDDGVPANAIAGRFAIGVTPVNAHAPRFVVDGESVDEPGGNTVVGVSVPENGTAVTTVRAIDADLPAPALQYRIAGGADAALFTVDARTGVLRFVRAPDFEAPADADGDNVYEIELAASDGQLEGLRRWRVTVTDVAEAPSSRDLTLTIAEDAPLRLAAADFGFSDADAGDALAALRIDAIAGGGVFSLAPLPAAGGSAADAQPGEPLVAGQRVAVADIARLRFTPAADANGNGYAALTFRVEDRSGLLAARASTLTVDVAAVDDAPRLQAAELLLPGDAPFAVTVNGSDLAATDVDSDAGALRFVITDARFGRFESTAAAGVALADFSQADLQAGRIRFVALAGREAAPTFDVAVSDGVLTSAPVATTVRFAAAAPLPPAPPTTPEPAVETPVVPVVPVVSAPAPQTAPAPVAPPATMAMVDTWTIDAMAAAPPQAGVNALPGDTADGAALRPPASALPAAAPQPQPTDAAAARAPQPEPGADGRLAALQVPVRVARIVIVNAVEPLRPARAAAEAAIADAIGLSVPGDASRTLLLPTDLATVPATRVTLHTNPDAARVDTPAGGTRGDEPVEIGLVAQAMQATGAALSAGSVWWALRSGGLAASLLVVLPAWRHVDLLAVLPDDEDDAWDADDDADGTDADRGHDEEARDEQAVRRVFDSAAPGRDTPAPRRPAP